MQNNPPQTVLALDYGSKRIGVAVGVRILQSAKALCTIQNRQPQRDQELAKIILTWSPDALVVGEPRYRDGQEHKNTHLARKFARHLQIKFKLPLILVDERYSTTEAMLEFSSKSKDIDALSAVVILNQYWAEQNQNFI